MGTEHPEVDLLRLLVAEIWFALSMKASRELYGRSYFSLGMGERFALDNTVASMVGANYFALMPGMQKTEPKRIAGFSPDRVG